jgi:hypothetical protein
LCECKYLHAEGRRQGTERAARRGRRWHTGQRWLERFMNGSRTIGVPQRGQGRPALPYTFRRCAK